MNLFVNLPNIIILYYIYGGDQYNDHHHIQHNTQH